MDHGPATRRRRRPTCRPQRPRTRRLLRIGHRGGARLRVPGNWPLLAGARRPGGPVAPAGRGGRGVPGRGAVPVGRPSGVGLVLHGTPIPPFPSYFSGRSGHLPAARPRWPSSVGGLAGARVLSLVFMLGGHHAAVGHGQAGYSGAGPRSSRPRCSPSSARRCTWARSPPTTPWRCSGARWPPGCVRAGRRPAGRDRLDDRGRASRWRWPTRPRTRRPCSTRSSCCRPGHRFPEAGRQAGRGAGR